MQKTLLAIIAAAVVTVGLSINFATASHEPADKTAGAATSVDEVNDATPLLTETMRVSSTSDLILSTTAECSILTSLHTLGGPDKTSEADGSFGQVELWITIDGRRVPVSSAEDDNGEVVFCNRAYSRTVTDNEQNEDGTTPPEPGGLRDGIDTEDDFIRTRTANGFNWMAFNVGKEYDTDRNNVVEVKLYGRFTKATMEDGVESTGAAAECVRERDTTDDEEDNPTPIGDDDLTTYGDTCADAYVGARSLIVEAVHASNHEQTARDDTGGS